MSEVSIIVKKYKCIIFMIIIYIQYIDGEEGFMINILTGQIMGKHNGKSYNAFTCCNYE